MPAIDWEKIDACTDAEQLVRIFRDLNPAATHHLMYTPTGGCCVVTDNA